MEQPHVVILGGGPAGVGAAYKLRLEKKARVTLLERNPYLGGNAGSFFENGQWLDFGSHRLHHASEPEILADIKKLLGSDLKDRPRNGRIRLRGKWVKFPLSGPDLMLRLDKDFALHAAMDMVVKSLPGGHADGDTFAAVLRANLGPTICEHFYFPYARKLWGREPHELSGIQARRRVSSGTFAKLLKKVVKPPGKGFFYYPREGFGQISRAYAAAAEQNGADVRLGWAVSALRQREGGWTVEASKDGETQRLEADFVWSTLPLTVAAKMMDPAPPAPIVEAADKIGYRAMLLVYVELPITQFHATDAHYFPEENVAMTRLSEPKNYFGLKDPPGRTVLCAEIPCEVGDRLWSMSDADLGKLVVDDMRKVDLIPSAAPTRAFARRLPQAYPIYMNGYERHLVPLDQWLSAQPNFLSYGRQGLFAHDNTHHALFMAYSATACLSGRRFDTAEWARFRKVFESHVVED
jgi:protoporphyrinogen oxidase